MFSDLVRYFDIRQVHQRPARPDFQITHMKTFFFCLASLVLTVQGFGHPAAKPAPTSRIHTVYTIPVPRS